VDPTSHDPKAGEKEYYQRIGEVGRAHARAKPFADSRCGHYLADAGALLMLLKSPPGKILEMGCGSGWLSLFLARAGYDVIGVDIAPEAIELAKQAAVADQVSRVRFVVGDYETAQSAAGGTCDAVIFYDALHHAEDEAAALRTAYAALKAGGALYAFEPGEGHGATEDSRRAVETYGVHEKDMPPRHIIALGRLAGFRRAVVLPSPHELTRTVYRRDFHLQPGEWRLRLEKLWGYTRAFQRMGRQRRGGLTVLWK
jgi:SAM-dependent methyltransferase